MEESGPANTTPEDILTPDDSLEQPAQAQVVPAVTTQNQAVVAAPATGVNGTVTPLPTSSPGSTVPQGATPVVDAEPRISPFRSKLFQKVGITSLVMVAIMGLLVLGAFVYQKTHQQQLSQSQQVARIKDQAVTLGVGTAAGQASLRVGVPTLFVNGDISSTGILRFSSGNNYGQLNVSNLSGKQTYSLPDSSGTVCLDSNNCGYATAGQVNTALQEAANATANTKGVQSLNGGSGALTLQGTTGQVSVTLNGQDVNLSLPQSIGTTSTPTFGGIKLNGTGSQNGNTICDASNNCSYVSTSTGLLQGGNSFGTSLLVGTLDNFGVNVQTNGTAVATFSNSGQATFKNASDSTTGFQVENAAGAPLFTVDTTNKTVSLGAPAVSPVVLSLGVGSSEPVTGTAGEMYYNSSLGEFRCYVSGWTSCISGTGAGSGDINNGGNSFGSAISIGTKDQFGLNFLVANQTVASFSTTNRLSLVGGLSTASVPQYMSLPGTTAYASTPNAAANQITGSIDIQARILPTSWSTGMAIVGKSNNALAISSYYFNLSSSHLNFYYNGGSGMKSATSSAAVGFADGYSGWVRVTLNTATGDVTFYTATDSSTVPGSWTPLGAVQGTVASPIANTATDLEVGSVGIGTITSSGSVYRARILNGIAGSVAVDFNPEDASSILSTSWNSSATSEAWTLNGNARLLGSRSNFSGFVGIGTSSYNVVNNMLSVNAPTTADMSAQEIVSTNLAGNKGIVIQGVSGQTGNPLEIQNSSGIALSGITANGGVFTRGVSSTLSGLNPPTTFCFFLCSPSMSTTGGTLATGTYYYIITSTNAAGESVGSVETSGTATTNTSSASVFFNSVNGATGYKIYRSTSPAFGASTFLASVTATAAFQSGGVVNYTDTGTATSAGTPPYSTTGAADLVLQGWSGQTTGVLQVQDPTSGTTLTSIGVTGQLKVTSGATVGTLPRAVTVPANTVSYISTPNASANQMSGKDLDIRVRVNMNNWAPGAGNSNNVNLLGKYDGIAADTSFLFRLNGTGSLGLYLSNGSTINFYNNSTATGITNGTTKWVRVTRVNSTGVSTFYTSDDGTNWTQLGATFTTFAGNFNSSTLPLTVGTSAGMTSNTATVYSASLYNGINGTLVDKMSPSDAASTSATSWVSSATGETWTLNGKASLAASPAQIVVDTGDTVGRGLILQGVSGQQGDLQQNQGYSGSVFSGVNASGGYFTNGANSTFGPLTTPQLLAATGSTSGGTLAANTYGYVVTAFNSIGETVMSNIVQVTTTGSTSSVALSWTQVPGATGYKIYRNSGGQPNFNYVTPLLLATISGGATTTLTDTGTATTTGIPPLSTTGSNLTLQAWNYQSNSVLQIQNSSGTNLTTIGANGTINVTNGKTIGQVPYGALLPGTNDSYASTPDAPANEVTGDIDLRVKASLVNWATSYDQVLISKYAQIPASTSYMMQVTNGGHVNFYESNGTTVSSVTSSTTLGLAANTTKWIRATRVASTGVVTIYTSDDGSNWTQLGTPLSTPSGNIFASNWPVFIGLWGTNSAPLNGTVYRAKVLNGINGSTVVDFNPLDGASTAATSWASSTTGETWTLSGSAKLVGASSQVLISSGDTASQGIIIQGVSGQTANLQEWQSSTGTGLLAVTSAGALQGANGLSTDTAGGNLTLNAGQGRGTGAGGNIVLQVAAPAGSTGNSLNSLATVATFSGTNGSLTLQNSVDSTTAFQIKNQAGTGILTVDTTNQAVTLGPSAATATLLTLGTKNTAGDPASTTEGTIYYNSNSHKFRCYQNSSWTDCISTGGVGSGTGDINQGGNGFGANVTLGSTDNFGLNLITNSRTVASFSNTGQALFKNSSDSTTAFQIQNAAGTSLLTADSSNSVIYVGNPTADNVGTLLVLDTKNTAGDPTGINGAMYYNSSLGKFRCYENNSWTNCIYSVQTAVKTANQTFSATSYADATDLSFSVLANKSYRLQCSLVISVPAGTNGGNLSTNGPASPTQLTATFAKSVDQSGGDNYATSSSYDDGSAATTFKINTVSTGSNRFIVSYNALLVNGASNGIWTLRSKAYDGSSSITIYANSSCNMQPL